MNFNDFHKLNPLISSFTLEKIYHPINEILSSFKNPIFNEDLIEKYISEILTNNNLSSIIVSIKKSKSNIYQPNKISISTMEFLNCSDPSYLSIMEDPEISFSKYVRKEKSESDLIEIKSNKNNLKNKIKEQILKNNLENTKKIFIYGDGIKKLYKKKIIEEYYTFLTIFNHTFKIGLSVAEINRPKYQLIDLKNSTKIAFYYTLHYEAFFNFREILEIIFVIKKFYDNKISNKKGIFRIKIFILMTDIITIMKKKSLDDNFNDPLNIDKKINFIDADLIFD